MGLKRQVFATALAIAVSGCGTINNRVALSYFPENGPFEGYAHGGVSADAAYIVAAFDVDAEVAVKGRVMKGLLATLFALDLPLSAAVDTLLLPVTVPEEFSHRQTEAQTPKQGDAEAPSVEE